MLANDEDGTSVYTLSGDDVDWFTIDAATGQIRVGADADMDYEGIQNSFSVVVTATTTAGMSASVDVTIDIIDINLGPYDVDHNELIDMNEALAAARDYFDDVIEMAETTRVVRLYLYPHEARHDEHLERNDCDEPGGAPAGQDLRSRWR